MISDILDHPHDARLTADVVVVGSGLAGAEAARQLELAGHDVLVLESGRRDFDPDIQALCDAREVGKPHRRYEPGSEFHAYLPQHYRGHNRIRQFGGTSNAWTGKWRAYAEGDFDAKPWIPNSSWPLELDDLRDAYAAVARDYGLGDVFAEMDDPRFDEPKRRLGRAGLSLAIHFWESSQSRVPERFGRELEASRNVHVLLGATATNIVLDDSRERATAVECACREGRRVVAVARHAVVLATGGLEVPRLLLASNTQLPAGVGNERGLVGRYYIDHPKNQKIRLYPGPAAGLVAPDVQGQPRPRFCLSLGLDDAELARGGLLRHSLYLTPVYEGRLARARRILTGGKAVRDGVGRVDHYRVKFATEQVPQADSRVYLGETPDALGVPELVIDWRFTDLDHRSIAETCERLKVACAAAGLGRLVFPAEPMGIEQTMDAAHPMGTARMADSPGEGVVDRDCRVFGTDNLYVASSAVFPTGAVYSPTYTIVALARRLGRHLAGRLARQDAPAAVAAVA